MLVLLSLLLSSPPALAEEPVAPAGATEAERLEQFKEQVVLFEDWVGISASTGVVVSSWTVPKKGIYGEPLNGAAFYEYINKPELAASYRKRNALNLGLRFGGLALGSAGLALAVTNNATECSLVGTGTYPQASSAKEAQAICRKENEDKRSTQMAGYALGGLGVVSLTASLTFGPHPVPEHERKKMAAQFNKNLAQELQLDPNAAP